MRKLRPAIQQDFLNPQKSQEVLDEHLPVLMDTGGIPDTRKRAARAVMDNGWTYREVKATVKAKVNVAEQDIVLKNLKLAFGATRSQVRRSLNRGPKDYASRIA